MSIKLKDTITDLINKANKDGSGNIITDTYLPLSGGTINGTGISPLKINTDTPAFELNFYSKNVIKLSLGFNTGDGIFFQERTSNDYIGISPDGTPYYYHTKRSTLLHAYNFQNYALPLSGGTLTGSLTTKDFWSGMDGAGTYIEGLTTLGIRLQYKREDEKYDTLYLNNGTVTFNKNIILHSDNYSSYALSVSGGEIKSSYFCPFTIHTSDKSVTRSSMTFRYDNENKGQIGWDSYQNRGTFLYNYSSTKFLGIANDGTPYYDDYSLIHSGNIGSQSVNYATSAGSINGYTITNRSTPNYTDWQTAGSKSIVTEKFLSYWTGAHTADGGSNLAYCIKGAFGTAATANKGDFASASHDHNYIISPYYYAGNVMTNSITSTTLFGDSNTINKLSCGFMKNHPTWGDYADIIYYTGYCKWGGTQIAAQYNSNKPKVAIRKFIQNSSLSEGGTWGDWVEFITTANIGSQSVNYATSAGYASQLTTSRSIWGQSFNGTGNIAISTAGQMKYLLFTGTDGSTAVGYVGRGASGNNNIYLTAYTASKLMLGTNNKDGIVVIDSNEKIGVGTQSPSYKFDVYDSKNSSYDIHSYNEYTKSSFFVGNECLWFGVNRTSGPLFSLNSSCTYDGGGGVNVFQVDASGYTKAKGIYLTDTGYTHCGLMPNVMITSGGNAKDIWLYNENLVNIYGSSITLNSGTFIYGKFYFDQPSAARDRGIIGSYDPNRAAAIWAMGSSYQIKSDGTTFGSLYGAAYAYFGSGYTFGAGYSGGHSFVWCQNGTPYAALGDFIWAVGGFKKSGSSNSYVLLGGGDHKAISDFITTSNIGSLNVAYASCSTYLYASDSPYRYSDTSPYYMRIRYNTNSDNRWYLSMYPETPKTISVDYAYHAGSVDGYHISVGSSAGSDSSTIYFVV